jgi:hypothetical protein
LPDGTQRVFRWVNQLSYTDDQKRPWSFHALHCAETAPSGEVRRFAWLTPLPVKAATVDAIAEKGGRARWKIENEVFNRQKNSGLNLEHVYSLKGVLLPAANRAALAARCRLRPTSSTESGPAPGNLFLGTVVTWFGLLLPFVNRMMVSAELKYRSGNAHRHDARSA